jgi:hypothetical protein
MCVLARNGTVSPQVSFCLIIGESVTAYEMSVTKLYTYLVEEMLKIINIEAQYEHSNGLINGCIVGVSTQTITLYLQP